MFVITVEFQIKPAHRESFMREMAANAIASVEREPGCRQFDVCVSGDDPNKVFLYEIYDDRAAFDAHKQMPHFLSFDTTVKDWVARKTVASWTRTVPA
jgi:quinol monooxygenase YgiN